MPKIPPMVGNYRVVSQLGQGGMARALLAIRQGPGRFRKLFVVKQLRLDFCEDPNFVAMFLDEARLAALLNHPNVVQTHETGEDLHSRFISMEYLEGQSLGRLWGRANKTKSMSLNLSIHVIAETLSGLHYAHQLTDLNGEALSVVHRDVSPGNVFVTYDGQVKLLDFGIAQASGGYSQADDGALKGKLSYMAPEQAMTKPLDCRADIFAVGVILWEAIAGRRMVPRKQEDAVTISNRVRGGEPSIDIVCPDAPKEIRAICRKAMALDPEDRYANAKELRSALLKYLSGAQETPSADDLATLVCDLFAKEREAIGVSIAKTIAADDPITMGPEVLDAWNTYTGENPLHTPLPNDDLEIEIIEAEQPTILDSRRLEVSSAVKTDPAVLNSDPDGHSLGHNSSGNRKLVFLGVAAATVAVIGTLVAINRGDDSANGNVEASVVEANNGDRIEGSETELPETERPETELPENVAQQESEVQIVISTSPSSAIIKVDGVVVDNPFTGAKVRDSKDHTIAVSGEGYHTREKIVSFAQAGEWQFTLDKDGDFDEVSQPGTKGGRRQRRERKKDVDEVQTPTHTVATTVEKNSDSRTPQSNVATETRETKKQDSRPKMGDDLGESNPKRDTNVEIDRNNPYQ